MFEFPFRNMATNWEAQYQKGETPWNKGEASPGLVDFLKQRTQLPKGRVFVPGCGYGHDARVWADAGYTVTAIDIAPSAVRLARQEATGRGMPDIVFREADFLHGDPDEPFDWLFEHTLYCAIDPSQRELYREAACRWLKPGGYLLAVHYLIPDEDGPPFGTTEAEVNSRFTKDFRLLESWVPRSYPNRTGLERMFWWHKS